jgi:hypothetical protein
VDALNDSYIENALIHITENLLSLLVALAYISINLLTVSQIVADHGIHIGSRQAGIAIDNTFRGFTHLVVNLQNKGMRQMPPFPHQLTRASGEPVAD